MDIKTLNEIEAEVKRFTLRLTAAQNKFKNDDSAAYGCKETGALKRAAMDLKNELTKITK